MIERVEGSEDERDVERGQIYDEDDRDEDEADKDNTDEDEADKDEADEDEEPGTEIIVFVTPAPVGIRETVDEEEVFAVQRTHTTRLFVVHRPVCVYAWTCKCLQSIHIFI